MKKFLSVVLALCLLLSGIVVSTSAAGNELTLGSEIRCQYKGEELEYTFTPQTDVYAVLYTKDADYGMDTNLAVYRNDQFDLIDYRDDEDILFNFCYGTTFEAGYTYTFLINDYYGTPGEFTLVLEEDPVDHYEVKNIPVLTADYMGNYEFSYNGIEVTIHYKDSSIEAQTVVFENSSFAETEDFFVSAEYVIESETEVSLEITYMDHAESFEVETNSKKVTGFEILTPPSCTTLYKDIDCLETAYFDEETYELKTFNMYNVYYFGMTAKITYEDGSFTEVNYDDNPEFFMSLENDLEDQRTSPWGIGKHTVMLSFKGYSDTFEVEVVENPYTRAEITQFPYLMESVALGTGHVEYDENYNEYFYYDVSLEGLEVTLYKKDGTKTVINDAYTILTKFRPVTDQETEHWIGGINGDYSEFPVRVFYGNMYIGSYDFTVWAMAVHEIEIVTPANAAFYYPENSDMEFDPTGLELTISADDGINTATQTIPYEALPYTVLGSGITVDWGYDEAKDNYYYYAYSTLIESTPIYFKKVTDKILDFSITNPPASLTYVNGYGLDVYNMDLSGLEVTVTTADNKKHVWKWNDSDKDGYDVFLDGVITVSASSNYVTVNYRDMEDTCYPDAYKDISEYSKGVISQNTTIGIDLNKPELQVYTFTPWTDGEYNFSVKGKPLTILGIFDEYSNLINAVLYEEQLLTNAEKETYSMEFYKGETYYILIEGVPLLGEFEDGNIDFTVDHALIGDIDGDGKITTKDVLALRKKLGGILTLTEDEEAAADCDGDGKITMKDVLALRKYLGGIITELPIPQ
ncbi:MAG: hypothetical protein E7660_04105 [Ruminococcaceae bacterium]|nr:hypothetical protein [Oscillospiraceae bacterium]